MSPVIAESVTGIWRWASFDDDGNSHIETLQLKENEGSLRRAIKSEAREGIIRIKDGFIKEKNIHFHSVFRSSDGIIKTDYKGTIKDGSIVGSMKRSDSEKEIPWLAQKKYQKRRISKLILQGPGNGRRDSEIR